MFPAKKHFAIIRMSLLHTTNGKCEYKMLFIEVNEFSYFARMPLKLNDDDDNDDTLFMCQLKI